MPLLCGENDLNGKAPRRIACCVIACLIAQRAVDLVLSCPGDDRQFYSEVASVDIQLILRIEGKAVARTRRILCGLGFHAGRDLQIDFGRNQQLRLRSVRVHMKSIDDPEA